MNFKHIWFWLLLALGLLGVILVKDYLVPPPPQGLGKVLPKLNPAEVTSVQVQLQGQLLIRAERTNGSWELTAPISYPAQAVSIDSLLAALEKLTPATFISSRERQHRPKADEEDGLNPPRATLVLQQGGEARRVGVGATTVPGDQVFIQVGAEGVFVVSAELLKLLPRDADAWRDTALVNLAGLPIDWLAITNGAKAVEVRRETPGRPWRIVNPPIQARADAALVDDLLQQLQKIRVNQFCPDDPKADLEAMGLQPAELQVGVGQGTNRAALLQFGKSPTNDASLVYARRFGQRTLVTVAREALLPWLKSAEEFRDPHLLSPLEAVDVVEVRGLDQFSLQRQSNQVWRVMPQNLPADSDLVKDLFSTLSTLRIVEFTKEAATPQDWVRYGLATPSRQYWLKAATTTNATGQLTNVVLAELAFGTNSDQKVFVRRADEVGSVYAVAARDFQHLPGASWQLRDRHLWELSETNLTGVNIRMGGKQRQLLRKGTNEWVVASGGSGLLDNDLSQAIEETVKICLCAPAVEAWLGHGQASRARFGFADNSHQVTLETKDGRKFTMEFGRTAVVGPVYAAVTLDGEPWFFEFPRRAYDGWVEVFLGIPPGP